MGSVEYAYGYRCAQGSAGLSRHNLVSARGRRPLSERMRDLPSGKVKGGGQQPTGIHVV